MATWPFSGYTNGRGAAVTFTYTAAFDPATNKTRVTITNYTAAFNTGGETGYCQLTGTLTVKAADNTASYGTMDVSHSKNGNSPTVSTDVSQVIEVSHGTGTSKQVILAFSGDINAVTYHSYPDENTTVSVYTASAYTLTLNNGAGTGMEVYLYYSPFRSKSDMFTSGDTIYTSEVIRVWAGVLTGYENLVINVSNVGNLNNADIFTVTGNHVIKTSATLKSYTLTLTTDGHCALTVTRSGSTLASGDTIYYGDSLNISFSALTGYEVKSAVLNGVEITSPCTHEVTGSVDITIVTALLSSTWIYVNGSFKRYFINIYIQGAWRRYREKIFPGGGTEQQAICGQALCGTIKCGG